MREKHGLDATDIRILGAVQKHGPLSNTRLAEIVNLSPTPCWERLARLKAAGFIRGYRAEIALDRMTQANDFGFGTQTRRSPYFDATLASA